MERHHKNSSRNWLLHSISRPSSIKARLLITIGIIFSLTWLVAVVFTKLTAFDRSRDFLKQQTTYIADTFLDLAKNNSLNQIRTNNNPTRALLLWKKDKLLISQNDKVSEKLRGYKARNTTSVLKIDHDNWIITSRCSNDHCIVIGYRDTERKFAIRWLVASIFLPLLGIFIIALIGIFLAIKYGLKPLDDLAEEVQNLDLNRLERLPVRNRSVELHPLCNAIDTLSENMTKQLERERRFLDACAHEIRTPVTGLVSQVQALENFKTETTCTEMKNTLSLIERSAQRTARVANQFLSLAKTTNSYADLSHEISFDLSELVRMTISDILTVSPKIDIQMTGDRSLWVAGEPFAIELIIQNLIDNALKYNTKHEKLKVLITCSKTTKGIAIRLEDNGIGVPASQYPLLTNRFFRLERQSKSGTNQTKSPLPTGAGLGLSIVKEVVTMYGGDLLFAKSETLGGLAVIMTLNIPSSDEKIKLENPTMS